MIVEFCLKFDYQIQFLLSNHTSQPTHQWWPSDKYHYQNMISKGLDIISRICVHISKQHIFKKVGHKLGTHSRHLIFVFGFCTQISHLTQTLKLQVVELTYFVGVGILLILAVVKAFQWICSLIEHKLSFLWVFVGVVELNLFLCLLSLMIIFWWQVQWFRCCKVF